MLVLLIVPFHSVLLCSVLLSVVCYPRVRNPHGLLASPPFFDHLPPPPTPPPTHPNSPAHPSPPKYIPLPCLPPPLPNIYIPTLSLAPVVTLGGYACENCVGDASYSFDPSNITCDLCPPEANCSGTGSFLRPEAMFWHSHPFSPQLHRCFSTRACAYPDRTTNLTAAADAFAAAANGSAAGGAAAELAPRTAVLISVDTYYGSLCSEGHTVGGVWASCRPIALSLFF
eukprot:350534-Chlamydomonas_euryale.AAC.2